MQVADDRSLAYSFAQERLEQLQFRNQTSPNQPVTEVDNATGIMWRTVVPLTITTYTSMETLLTQNTTDPIIIGAFHDTLMTKTITNIRDGNEINHTFNRSTLVKIHGSNPRLVQVKVTVSWVDRVGSTQNVDIVTYYGRQI